MNDFSGIELKRLALQAQLDSEKNAPDRNRLGQYATPSALANDILKHGLSLLGDDENIRFLDPAIGTGSFYSALRKVAPANRIASAIGYEIDEHYALPAKKLWARHKLEIKVSDFTKASPNCADLANLVICNPPYVRHHHISAADKVSIQAATRQSCGVSIGGLSGLYCYFLGLAHRWMSPGGIAGWLIPSEFMDVNYGQQIKNYLLEKVTLLHVHRFDPTEAQFDDALVSSAVVWFRNERPKPSHQVKFTFGGSLSTPKTVRFVAADVLASERKWTRYPAASSPSKAAEVTLGDLFKVTRGIATGDNKFFVLSKSQIADRGLPIEFFRPVLPSARYLPNDIIEADESGNPILEKELFLLDTDLSEAEIKTRNKTLWQYLQSGKSGDSPVSQRYLCNERKLWYAQEKRPASPFMCTYMGRPKNGERPFRFIRNKSRATACNVYLMLYPSAGLSKSLRDDPRRYETVWNFLQGISAEELLGNGRVYGGGLYKLEPKELRRVSAAQLLDLLPGVMDSAQLGLFDTLAA